MRLFERRSRSQKALLRLLYYSGIFPRPWNSSGSVLLSSLAFVLPFRDHGMTWKKCKYKLYILCGQAGFQSWICRPTFTAQRTDTYVRDFVQTHGNGYLYECFVLQPWSKCNYKDFCVLTTLSFFTIVKPQFKATSGTGFNLLLNCTAITL